MRSVDETKKRFDQYTEFTKYSQLNVVSYPFNIIDNLEVNVISTRKIIDDLLREAERHATDVPAPVGTETASATVGTETASATGAFEGEDVEVYIY